MDMQRAILDLLEQARPRITEATTEEHLVTLEKELLGRKEGALNAILKGLKDLSPEERALIGPLANDAKEEMLRLITEKKTTLQEAATQAQVAQEKIDISLPGQSLPEGRLHPLTQVQWDCLDIFRSLGFTVWDGPEVDSDYYNFQALNIPEHHPARDMQDTFYLENHCVLRTHTSSMQNRVLKGSTLPIRAVIPGRTFRNEATDASHDTTFYQLEGIVVDEHISIAHLLNMLQTFLKSLFGRELTFRIRPGYFPFVEPGLELDMNCLICSGKGCSVCKHTGWSEVMPCGMIHPNVLKEAGIDSEKYSGFAFGFGLTRLVMMKYGIEDIRLLMSGDLRFLRQF